MLGYKIGEFSNISGVSSANLRYYEQRGYPLPIRTNNGYRQYGLEDSYRINTFNALLAHGFTVSEAITFLDPHPTKKIISCLEERNAEIEGQIVLQQKRLVWNHMIQHILSHAEEELRQTRILEVPDLCFLRCTERFDHTPSLGNGELIAKWVELIPISLYSGYTKRNGDFSFGMIMKQSDAQKYGVDGLETKPIPGGDFYAMLIQDNLGAHLKDDPRVHELEKEGYYLPESFFHIFLMLETEEYGGFLNYVFLRK